MRTTWTTLPTPVGTLRLVQRDGALVGVHFLDGWGEPGAAESASVARHRARARGGDGSPAGEPDDDDALLVRATAQLREYFAGEREEFDLSVRPEGTPFQRRVWQELRSVPYGETVSYGALAARLGMTGHGARAVGLANGANPVPVVIPCHRVVGANGSLTGYGGGTARKQFLLELERPGLF